METEFVLAQIWIEDRKLGDLAKRQKERMRQEFDSVSIPLHAIVGPDGKERARFRYSPVMTPEDYMKFLDRAR